jgi:tripartite-type tricarboxylate transporter receptor subunit TctC
MIVPWPPGGSTDIMARIIVPALQKILGVSIQTDNRPGAGGSVGAIEASQAAPDGNTWILSYDTQATNEHVLRMPFKTMEAFTPTSIVARGPLVLVANSRSPFKSWSDVVSAAKVSPGDLNYATSGAGGLAHVATSMIARSAGIELTHVGYRGGAPAQVDVLANKVPLFMSNLAVPLDAIKDGRLIPLGVTGAKETQLLPGVKSFSEMGVRGAEAETWWCLMAIGRTPDPIIAKMNEAMNQVLSDSAILSKISEQGGFAVGGSSAQAGAFMAGEIEKWGRVIRENGITVDS